MEPVTYATFEPGDHCLVGMATIDEMRTEVWLSKDEVYRYAVWYMWEEDAHPPLVAVMLNPSTATHLVLDPTIRGMIQRAKAWGYGSLTVVNEFALRSTDPGLLYSHEDPVGPLNDIVLRMIMAGSLFEGGHIIAGWGAHGHLHGRDHDMVQIAKECGHTELYCVACTKNGSPGHPLYVKRDAPLTLWRELRHTARPRRRVVL